MHNLEMSMRDKDGPTTLANMQFLLDGFEIRGLRAVKLFFSDDDVNAAVISLDLENVTVDSKALLFLEGFVEKGENADGHQ